MRDNGIAPPGTSAYPDRIEPKDEPPGRGRPWISATRCRERFNEVVTQRIVPKLQEFRCTPVVLLPILDLNQA
jgi:hypothetical protein